MAQKISTVVLKVDLDCPTCCRKIKKTLSKFCVIRSQVFDEKQKTVTISGPFDPEKLMKKICCKAGDVIKGYEIKPDPPPAPKPAPPQKPEAPKPAAPPPKPEAPKPAPPPQNPEAPKPAPPPPKPEAPKPAPPPPKPEAPKPAPPPPKPEAPKPAPPPPNPEPVVGPPSGSMYPLPVPIGPGSGCGCRSYHGYDWNKCCDRRCPTCGNYVCGWDYFTEESSSCKPM